MNKMKKKKRALTKQQRNAILQSLQRSSDFNVVVDKGSETSPKIPSADQIKENISKTYTSQIQVDYGSFVGELKKIALVGGIIIILLAGTVLVNQKTNYLTEAGSFITDKIGL